ncbi:protein ENHANCED DISEASE RESISTANCE 2-like [Sesamum angolense]|uniref:Protein ENHANCED DISEASE RESISTANCE 2-like n=1 Tax=Sesamum angolense TaxID=2727404 RepID=A0AAE1W354_9LAMI|nr:protein ENHANCED DISEASE RESISTANCE 2-like [Sesamum angolense]
MGMAESEGKMEGWLYLIRFDRFGLQFSRKRYFVLEDNCLRSFKSVPTSETEEPLRSAIIDSCIRVVDNGRGNHHKRLFFVFTLYNTSNHNDTLKLAATSSEEAARWIRSLQAAADPGKSLTYCSRRKYQPFSLTVSRREAKTCIDWSSLSSWHVDAMTSDVIAPSPWKILAPNMVTIDFQYFDVAIDSCCSDIIAYVHILDSSGLRLFKEAKDGDPNGKHWDDHPAIMAIGVIDGTSEAVFHTLMSLGTSRTEWDFCFYKGVVEHLDGHTDIIHVQLYNHWLPWTMKRRDFLLRRYWRREDDGTYVILYHSVVHKKCPPQSGYVRACLKSNDEVISPILETIQYWLMKAERKRLCGGYVITPIKQGRECVIKHMLAVDWKFWRSYLRKGSEIYYYPNAWKSCRAKAGNLSHDFLLGDLPIDIAIPESEKEEIKTEVSLNRIQKKIDNETPRQRSGASSLVGLNDSDEFFDVPEPSDDDLLENGWSSNTVPESFYVDKYQQKLSSAATLVKKLQGLAVQKKGYVDLQGISWEESVSSCYGSTLPKDTAFNTPCSWAASDPSSFLIRGANYLEDHQKITAKGTLMQMVAADWLRSDNREDDLAGRPGSIVQRYAERGGPEFFFIINIQVPGSTTYNLALYYMLKTPLKETPLLEHFVNGDNAFRNSRFKLIPYISKGSWIVKQSVGRKACLVGQALEINYFRGTNYLELGVDIGSSTVARGVVSLVLGYLNNLVIEMAFLIQGNTPEELPEFLLGTCRLNHLDAAKAVSTDSVRVG